MSYLSSASVRRAVGACIALSALAGHAAEPGKPYAVDVWADVLFSAEGRAERADILKPEQYPPGFVERLKPRFVAMRIPAVKDESGQAATFQTGVRMIVEITPPGADGKGGSARISGAEVLPLVLKPYAASQPDDLPKDSTTLADVECTVGTQGACTEAKVIRALPESASFRRWALASIRGYQFAPQRVNGTPVPGQFKATLQLEVLPDATVPDFRSASDRLPGR